MEKTVVRVFAHWCTPCKSYEPIFNKVKEELQSDIEFVDVDIDDDPEGLTVKYKVKGIPHTIVLENGIEVRAQSGVMNEAQLRSFILG